MASNIIPSYTPSTRLAQNKAETPVKLLYLFNQNAATVSLSRSYLVAECET